MSLPAADYAFQTLRWTDIDIIDAFHRFNDAMGRPPTVDDRYPNPSRRARMTAARIAECEQVVRLGLRLPSQDTVSKRFGSWGAALEAAGFESNGTGWRRETPARFYTTSSGRSDLVCPSCGEFRSRLHEVTGWCARCTGEHWQAVA